MSPTQIRMVATLTEFFKLLQEDLNEQVGQPNKVEIDFKIFTLKCNLQKVYDYKIHLSSIVKLAEQSTNKEKF